VGNFDYALMPKILQKKKSS